MSRRFKIKRRYKHDVDYYGTPEWLAVRRIACQRAGYRCERELTGGRRHKGPVDAHHKSYAHFGHEIVEEEVEVLCRECHEADEFPNNKKKRELESVGQTRLFDRWGWDWDDEDDQNNVA